MKDCELLCIPLWQEWFLDSIVVVVSEETGKISVAKDGTLIADVREDVLKKILITNIVTKRFTEEQDKKDFVDKIKNKIKNKSK